MDALLAAIAKGLGEADNIGLLVSVLFNIGLAWAHVVWRREERTDRAEMLKTFSGLTDAINNMKNFLSATSGRPIQ